MSNFKQKEFNQFILNNGVFGFFEKPITLKSGKLSNWYVNWRNVAEDVFLIDQLTDYVISFVGDLRASGALEEEPACYYGVPEGVTKLAILAQYKLAKASPNFAKGSHVLAMGRAKPKDHGVAKDRFFVGAPNGATIVIEDVTTTGGSLLTAIDGLLESGVRVLAAVGLTNRLEQRDDGMTVAQAIATRKSEGKPIRYFHMSSALELLPEALDKFNPPAAVRSVIANDIAEREALQGAAL